jgi:hypothetical protein
VGPDDIPDEEGLLRRIPPWHEPQENQNPAPGDVPSYRPPSAAFALDRGDDGLSFHLESSLRAAGQPLTYGCPPGEPGWAVARIDAGTVRRLGLRIERDDKPHHVQVFGLAALTGATRRKMQRELARHSVYVVPPRVI